MFVANVITVWVQALKSLFDSDYVNPDLREVTIGTNFPAQEVEYPNIWVNFVTQGDVSNVGIGHVERATEMVDGEERFKEVFRWSFSGHVEMVVGAMGNLERALMVDEITKAIAVARVDENDYGILRSMVMINELVGMIPTWESITIGGFGEIQGTPWGTDDVIYEASVSLPVEGEVVLDPSTGLLVPLTAIQIEALGPGEGDPPVVTGGTAIGEWV